MTERESQIFEWIKENPMITQQEIAERAGITRSSAAVHISNLMKKGMIKGKGYVLCEENYVTVIGAVNIDISGTPYNPLKSADSNPGHMEISFGGVGRNIADNMCRLGTKVEMITVLGDDVYATELEKNCRMIGIEIANSLKMPGCNTSTYLCVNTASGDMSVAISDMEIYENLTPSFVETKLSAINKSQYVVIDGNIPEKTIEFLAERCTAPIIAEPVSSAKAKKFGHILDKIFLFKPNELELETLTGIEVKDDASLEKAAEKLLEAGVSHLIVSIGSKGVYYASKNKKKHFPCLPCSVVNTTGCGDALLGGITWAIQKGMEIEEAITYGLAAASVCIEHDGAINSGISESLLKERLDMYNMMQSQSMVSEDFDIF